MVLRDGIEPPTPSRTAQRCVTRRSVHPTVAALVHVGMLKAFDSSRPPVCSFRVDGQYAPGRLELLADHPIERAAPGAAEKDGKIEQQQQQREFVATALRAEEVAEAEVPAECDDRELYHE